MNEIYLIGSTILYAALGIIILMLSVILFDKVFKLNLHKELVEDQNIAFGILLGGVSIAIAIIIASAII